MKSTAKGLGRRTSLLIALLQTLAAGSAPAGIIGFEDVSSGGTAIANPYSGLIWSNFYCYSVTSLNGSSGYSNAVSSGTNFVANGGCSPAMILCSVPFNLNTAYVAAAWRDDLQLQVTGFRQGALLYSNSFTLSATNGTSLGVNCLGVDMVVFSGSGGTQHAGYSSDGPCFGLDDLSVTLLDTVQIAVQPTNATVAPGDSVTFSVSADGLPPFSYQWQFYGTNIAGATNASIVLANVQFADAGPYSVVVSSLYDSIGSSSAILAVVAYPPSITAQPLSQTVATNSTLSFVAGVAGTAPIACQWWFNGALLDGATNTTLTLSNVSLAAEGNYSLTASNAYGTTNTISAFLNVVDLPEALDATNLDWSTGGDAPWFVQTATSHDGIASLQSGALEAGQQSTLQTTVTGPGTLAFWWRVSSWPASDYLVISVNGVEQARMSGDSGWQQGTLYLGVGPQVVQWAYIKTDSAVGGADGGWVDQVSYVPGGTPPFITLIPTNQVVVPGLNTTLYAAALGTPPLSYQWELNFTDLDGATSSSLLLTNVQSPDEGVYTLVVSNAFGVTNASAYVNVVDLAEALNATNLTWSSTGNLPWRVQTATTQDGIALQSGAIAASQQSTIQTTAAGPGTLSFWWKVSSETNNDYVSFSVDGSEQARISGAVNWQQRTFYLVSGDHVLTWTYAKNASVNSGSDAAWLDQVSYVPGATAAFPGSGPTDQIVAVSSNATFSVVAQGTPPFSYQWSFNNTAISGATNPVLTIANVQLTSVGAYAVAVSNDYGGAVSVSANLSLLSVYAWGAGVSNTGVLPNYGQSMVPTNLAGVSAIAAGGYHCLSLRTNARVTAWGYSGYQQTNVPTTPFYASSVAGGLYFSLALKTNGTVIGWGEGFYSEVYPPTSATNVTALSAGWYHGLALRSNRTVVAWGAGTSRGSTPNLGQSIVPTNLTGVAAVAGGGYHSLALRSDGTVVGWGWNASGQTNVPAGLSNVVAIAAGASNSVALKSDGTVVAWGANDVGQSTVPAGLSNVVSIAAGAAHVLALRSDGTLITWGLNTNGQTTVPPYLTNVMAVSGGVAHSLALVNVGPVTFFGVSMNQTVYKGSAVSLGAACLGLGPLSYQWLNNGTNISDATNAALAFAAVQLSDAGGYQLVASNSFGAVTSGVVTLTVYDTVPSFVSQPTNQTVLQNSNVTFAAAVRGFPTPTCQWLFGGAAIPGATNTIFLLTNAQPANQGNYSLLASNVAGVTISSNAFLDVVDVPQALNATNLTWLNSSVPAWASEFTNTHDGYAAAIALSPGQQSPLQTVVTGPGTLSFWWANRYPASDVFTVDGVTYAGNSQSVPAWSSLTFYLGAGVHSLSWAAINQPYNSIPGQTYLDQVTYAPGPTPVSIVTQPVSQTNLAGATATFSVSALGTPPFNYQWYFESGRIPGATNGTLALTNVQASNVGEYSVVVDNGYGPILSSNAFLAVTPAAPAFTTQPTSAYVPLGRQATFSGSASGSMPLLYQWLLNSQPIAGATNNLLTLNNVQYSDGGTYNLLASNVVGTALSSNAYLFPFGGPELGAALNSPGISWSTTNVPWFPETNITHDAISAAQSGAISGTQQSTLQCVATGPATVTYWWKANCDSFWMSLGFAVGTNVQSAITGNVDWQPATNYIGAGGQALQWTLYPVHNAFAGGTGWVDQVTITPGGTAARILANPTNVTTSAGNNAAFSVSGIGTPPMRYQWRFNGSDLTGATNSSLTLANVQTNNAGSYSAVVSNDFGPALSANATLAVVPSAPVITAQPVSQSAVTHGSAAFSVTVKGSIPFGYQWQFNGAPILAATSTLLSLTNLQTTDGGNYTVAVTNGFGSVTSSVAKLTISPTAVIDYWPRLVVGYSAPANLGMIVAIAAGKGHTVALRQDGTVTSWGYSSYGLTNVPVGLSNVIAIAAGDYHTIALKRDGTVTTWGDNTYGQLLVPAGLSNVIAVAAAANDTFVLKNDGTVAGWGNNLNGQLGIPPGLANVQAIAAGPFNAFAVENDGTVVQWGNGPTWQMNGTNVQLTVAPNRSDVLGIASGGMSAWTLANSGIVYSWGWDSLDFSAGQFAAAAIAAAGTDTLRDYLVALSYAGTIFAVGSVDTYQSAPYIPASPANAVAVAAGYGHAAVLMNDGSPCVASRLGTRTFYTGSTVVFLSGVVGAAPASYQWRFNGTNMAGATSGVLRLSNLGTANAGAYDVVVTNAYGSITSSVATLVVQLLRPAILSQGAGFSAGHFGFDVSGPAGLVVAVEASTDFTDWVPLQTSALINGQAHFTDPATALTPQRFYRAHFVYGTSPQPVLQVPAATPPSSAQFGFYVDALPGQQISIQASTNLVDWTAAGTYTLLTGYYFYTNPAVAGLPARFYRATAQ